MPLNAAFNAMFSVLKCHPLGSSPSFYRIKRCFSRNLSSKQIFKSAIGYSGRHSEESGNQRTSHVFLNLRSGMNIKKRSIRAKVGDTLLHVARQHGFNVDGTCDGKLECSTCHCLIHDSRALSFLPKMSARESDLLHSASGVGPQSRLACQVRVSRQLDGVDISFPNNIKPKKSSKADTKCTQVLSLSKQISTPSSGSKQFNIFTKTSIPSIFRRYAPKNTWCSEHVAEMFMTANILPFRTNNYVLEELIDWSRVPNDPIFQLNFPQPGMLSEVTGIDAVKSLLESDAPPHAIRTAVDNVRKQLNPHPAKQVEMNVPVSPEISDDSESHMAGVQHKYRETVLFFPSESQYCHSYCTYCFRWPQFVGWEDKQFASKDLERLISYLRINKQVSDVLITGGDPFVMNYERLARYLDALSSDPSLEHIQTIRLGTKSLAYWPYKFVTDKGADDILNLLERTVKSGKHVAFMAHFTHPLELSTLVVRKAISRIQATGTVIRCQAPLVNHVNNDAKVWSQMWKEQVHLGMVPYYMFVERDTGAQAWFAVPLERALDVYSKAIQTVSGVARTVRGPSMSCDAGKVQVVGIETIRGERVFVLKFLQARNPKWNERVFFARYDAKATWMNNLKPAFGQEHFFFEKELLQLEDVARRHLGSSGQLF